MVQPCRHVWCFGFLCMKPPAGPGLCSFRIACRGLGLRKRRMPLMRRYHSRCSRTDELVDHKLSEQVHGVEPLWRLQRTPGARNEHERGRSRNSTKPDSDHDIATNIWTKIPTIIDLFSARGAPIINDNINKAERKEPRKSCDRRRPGTSLPSHNRPGR